jgi:hypothetical protein
MKKFAPDENIASQMIKTVPNEMLSSGANVIIWDEILSMGMKCYHLGRNFIIWS